MLKKKVTQQLYNFCGGLAAWRTRFTLLLLASPPGLSSLDGQNQHMSPGGAVMAKAIVIQKERMDMCIAAVSNVFSSSIVTSIFTRFTCRLLSAASRWEPNFPALYRIPGSESHWKVFTWCSIFEWAIIKADSLLHRSMVANPGDMTARVSIVEKFWTVAEAWHGLAACLRFKEINDIKSVFFCPYSSSFLGDPFSGGYSSMLWGTEALHAQSKSILQHTPMPSHAHGVEECSFIIINYFFCTASFA